MGIIKMGQSCCKPPPDRPDGLPYGSSTERKYSKAEKSVMDVERLANLHYPRPLGLCPLVAAHRAAKSWRCSRRETVIETGCNESRTLQAAYKVLREENEAQANIIANLKLRVGKLNRALHRSRTRF